MLARLLALTLATTWAPHTLEDRVRLADRVVLAQVLRSQTRAEHGDARRLKTFTELAVGEDYKGRGPLSLTVVQLGGELGQVSERIPGDARFEAGQVAVLFLRCGGSDRCHLVGLEAGVAPVSGGDAFVLDVNTGKRERRPLAALGPMLRAAGTLPSLEKLPRAVTR
ncbi:MAG: hypothetical protein K1X89_04190 [Myxococcaceae bacterium]|nr:hypothetical protein [Myxococcaceae bacterium]